METRVRTPLGLRASEELGDTTAVGPLLAGLQHLDEKGRLQNVAKLRAFPRREHESELRLVFLAETANQVRAVLMDTPSRGGTAARDLALMVLSDYSEAPSVRAAAACTLGCTSVGEPEAVAALKSALDDANPDIVVRAARGSRGVSPPRPGRLLADFVADTRVPSAGETVGVAVAEEIEALKHRCR